MNEVRENERIIAVAGAKNELLYKAGTRPSIQEMIKIFEFCSFVLMVLKRKSR